MSDVKKEFIERLDNKMKGMVVVSKPSLSECDRVPMLLCNGDNDEGEFYLNSDYRVGEYKKGVDDFKDYINEYCSAVKNGDEDKAEEILEEVYMKVIACMRDNIDYKDYGFLKEAGIFM